MSSTTQRRKALVDFLPAILRPQPALIDPVEEMRVACAIARKLNRIDPTSRLRILKHAWAIEQDNRQRFAEFYGEDAPAADRIDDSQVA